MMTLDYRPAGEPPESKQRVAASVWADAGGGRKWVIPLDGGDRRFVLVKRVNWVWVETQLYSSTNGCGNPTS